jgi:uncharacterized membrane protein
MRAKAFVLLLVLFGFAALTAVAVKDHGYFGIISFHFTSTAGLQVIVDLVIVCMLAILWIVDDARRNGRVAWPYVVVTLALGSFGPLLYLLVGCLSPADARRQYA